MILTLKLKNKCMILRKPESICCLLHCFVRDTSCNRFKLAIFGIHLAFIYFVLSAF